MRKTLFFIVITCLMIVSCAQKKAHLFVNKNYDMVVPESGTLHSSLHKRLRRDFFSVRTWNFESFKAFPNTLKTIISQNKGGLLVIDDFLAPVVLKGSGFETDSSYACLTWNQPEEVPVTQMPFPVFNVSIRHKALSHRIGSLMRRYSSNQDASDCLVIVNSDYELCNAFLDDLSDDRLYPRVEYYEGGGIQDIRLTIEDPDFNPKCVVFFAYGGNKMILDLDKEEYPPFIEVMSRTGEVQKNVKYRVAVDWNRAVKYAMSSYAFNRFITASSDTVEQPVMEYWYAWQPDVISVSYYFSNFTLPFVKQAGEGIKEIRKKVEEFLKSRENQKNKNGKQK
jgi:hypothetical protein